MPGFSPTDAGGGYDVTLPAGTTEVGFAGELADRNGYTWNSPDSAAVDVSCGSGRAVVYAHSEDDCAVYTYVIDFVVESPTPTPTSEIDINNINNNETISYEVLTLRGITESSADKVNVSVNGGDTTQWSVHPEKKTFKALAQLSPGANTIKLSAPGHNDKYLTINYEPKVDGPGVKFTYLVPCDDDGSFKAPQDVDNSLASAKKRYALMALLAQSAWAECMNDRGYGRQTFRIEREPDTQEIVNVQYASKTRAEMRMYTSEGNPNYTDYDLYNYVHGQVSADPNRIKNHVMISCSERVTVNGVFVSIADLALGGGALAAVGGSTLYTIPEDLSGVDSTLYNTTNMNMYDTSRPYWSEFGVTVAASMHELGHCFGLSHLDNNRMINWDTGAIQTDYTSIMGTGFYLGNRLFAVRDGNGNDFNDNCPVSWNKGYIPGGSTIQNDCEIISQQPWFYLSSSREAEDQANTMSGTTYAGPKSIASNGKIIFNIGSNPNNYITLNDIYVREAGDYKIRLYYMAGSTRRFYIAVNGIPSQYVDCASESWNYVYTKDVVVRLDAGYNAIKFYNDTSYAPDLDRIVLVDGPI